MAEPWGVLLPAAVGLVWPVRGGGVSPGNCTGLCSQLTGQALGVGVGVKDLQPLLPPLLADQCMER